MLDLTLDHLGLITQADDGSSYGRVAEGLADIVGEVGKGQYERRFNLTV